MKALFLILTALVLSAQAYGLCLTDCEGEKGILDGALQRSKIEGDKSLYQSTAKFKPWGVGIVTHTISSGSQNAVEEIGAGNNAFYVENNFSPYFSLGATLISASFDSLKDQDTGQKVTDEYKHEHLIGYFGSRMWITNSFQLFLHTGLSLSSVDFGKDSWSGTGKVLAIGFKYQSTNNSPMMGIQQTTITGSSGNEKMNLGFNSIGITFGLEF